MIGHGVHLLNNTTTPELIAGVFRMKYKAPPWRGFC